MNQLALTNKRMMYFCFSKASIHLLQITCGLMHGNKGQFCHMSSPKHFESEAISSIMSIVEIAKISIWKYKKCLIIDIKRTLLLAMFNS